jgi:hypothetical protein
MPPMKQDGRLTAGPKQSELVVVLPHERDTRRRIEKIPLLPAGASAYALHTARMMSLRAGRISNGLSAHD